MCPREAGGPGSSTRRCASRPGRLHEQRLRAAAIAAEIGCSTRTVYALLTCSDPQPRHAPSLPADAVSRYHAGETVESIAKSARCRPSTAARLLAAAGADIPADYELRRRAEVIDRYTRRRQSIRAIAADIGRSYSWVHHTLTNAHIPMRPHGSERGHTRRRR